MNTPPKPKRRRREPHYPIQPLQQHTRLADEQFCKLMRISWATLAHYRKAGINLYRADTLAGRCNPPETPTTIWPDWGQR